MIFHPFLFKRITIIGVGLMGGSLGMAVKKRRLAREVIGFSKNPATLSMAMKKQAIDRASNDLAKALQNTDLVVLAAPVGTIIEHLSMLSSHIRKGCLVTDLGSAKHEVVEAAQKHLSFPEFFVGSHPLVGSEKKGVFHADPDLFQNAQCIMTPTEKTHPQARDRIQRLWLKMGAKVKFLSPEKHDEILGFVSHLPHVLAFGLMAAIPQEYAADAPQGLKDMTRIATSPPQLWNDICMANSRNVLKSLDECVKAVSAVRKAIIDRDQKTLLSLFTKAKEKRDSLI